MINDSQYKALYLLGGATGGSFDVWRLAGPASRKLRQDLMTLLLGRKLPTAQCGVTALQYEYWHLVPDMTVGCIAAKDNFFADWAKKVLTEPRLMPIV